MTSPRHDRPDPPTPTRSRPKPIIVERAFAAGPYGHLPVSAERRRASSATRSGARHPVSCSWRAGDRSTRRRTASVLRAGTRYSRVAVPTERPSCASLAVDPDEQGRGSARRSCARASRPRSQWGADALVLDTGARNRRAQALYERLGFERVPESRRTSPRRPTSRRSPTASRCRSATTCACAWRARRGSTRWRRSSRPRMRVTSS